MTHLLIVDSNITEAEVRMVLKEPYTAVGGWCPDTLMNGLRATILSTLAEAAAQAEEILISVSPSHWDDIFLGGGGILTTIKEGVVIHDASDLDPDKQGAYTAFLESKNLLVL